MSTHKKAGGVHDLQALVLDLRSNPGGLMESAIEIADMFLESGKIVTMKGRSVPERSWKAKRGKTLPMFPLAVIAPGRGLSDGFRRDTHTHVPSGGRPAGG